MNPSQHAEQFQSQLANYVPQFTPEFWPVWLIIAGVLLVGMWLVLGLPQIAHFQHNFTDNSAHFSVQFILFCPISHSLYLFIMPTISIYQSNQLNKNQTKSDK